MHATKESKHVNSLFYIFYHMTAWVNKIVYPFNRVKLISPIPMRCDHKLPGIEIYIPELNWYANVIEFSSRSITQQSVVLCTYE